MTTQRDRSTESALKLLRRRGYVVRAFWTPQGWRYEVRTPRRFFFSTAIAEYDL